MKSGFDLRADAEKSPVFYIVVTVLLAVGVVSIPLDRLFSLFIGDQRVSFLFAQSALRLIFSFLAVWVIIKLKFHKQFRLFDKRGFLFTLPAFLVAINNFPIIGFATGEVFLNADGLALTSYFIYCFSVGVFEELVFRGIVFPLFLILFKNQKNCPFWSVAISSLVFGLTHLINAINAPFLPTLLQSGYSFLIGCACAISLIYAKNVILPVLIHFIYDIGGIILLGINGQSGIAIGNQWDEITIIITAVLGFAVFVFYFILALKADDEKTKEIFSL